MIEIRQTEVYASWFAKLRDRQARARIDVRIRRLSLGNPGDVRPVGEGFRNCALITGQAIGSTLYNAVRWSLSCWLAAPKALKSKTFKPRGS